MNVSSHETVKLRSPMRTQSHPVVGEKVRKKSRKTSLNRAPYLWANGKRCFGFSRFFPVYFGIFPLNFFFWRGSIVALVIAHLFTIDTLRELCTQTP